MRYYTAFTGTNPTGDQAIIDASAYEWVIVTCSGLGAGETLTIERHIGSAWVAASINEGTAVIPLTLTGSGGSPANRNQVKIDACGALRVTGTAAAVTISYILGPPVTP